MPDSFCHRRHESIVRWQISRSQKKQRASRENFSITLPSNERAFQMSLAGLPAFMRIVWDISTKIRAPRLLFWSSGSHFSLDQPSVKRADMNIHSIKRGSKLITIKFYFFALFSNPAFIMIPDIANCIKSKWLTLKQDQLRWYLAKVGRKKNGRYPISDGLLMWAE